MSAIDWEAARERLVSESVKAVQEFAFEHANEECCYFAFDSDPKYGYVLLCFDTSANSLKVAQAIEQCAIERRTKMLTKDYSWEGAKHFLTSPSLAPFNQNTGDFAYTCYREINFPDWQQFAESEDYPAENERCDDFLDGHFRLLIWKVIEALLEKRAFNCLNKSSPFMIGYGIHDQEMSIVRILWGDQETSL